MLMYNFSGLYFRIWGVNSFLFLLGVVLIIFERPWKKGVIWKDLLLGVVSVAVAVCLSCVHLSHIYNPDVLTYTGEFISSNRASRTAPPLPVTYEYVFSNGIGKNKVFYLDIYSKREIYPDDFVEDNQYIIYYDDFTNVIVHVDEVIKNE